MSTIYGIFHRNLQPVSDAEAGSMVSAMDHWVPDAFLLSRTVNCMLGSHQLSATPEPLLKELPARLGHLTIVADIRLDNRDELAAMLGLSREAISRMRNDMLVLHAYRQYGRTCLAYLLGDFAFAIHDAEKDEVFCARDQLGVKPFFYFLDNGHFSFSSEVRGLLSQDYVSKEVDDDFVHCIMAQITPPLSRTFHRDILALEPAHYLIVGREKAKCERYWSIRFPPLLKLKNEVEYAEALREHFIESVARRTTTDGLIGLELSGGLDSSAIAAVAARQQADDRDRLFSFSNVMPFNAEGQKSYPDEEEFVDAVTASSGIRNVVKVCRSGWGSFLEPMDLSLEVNQGVVAYDAYWQEPLRREMSARGVRVVLSGFLGDEAVTTPAISYYQEMLWDGYLILFMREMIRRREFDLPLKALAKKILPADWLRRRQIRHGGLYKRNSFLKDKELEEKLEYLYAERGLPPNASLREQIAYRITRRFTTNRMQGEALYAIPHRLEYRYPFADLRLLEFFLSVPLPFLGKYGASRHLFREAFRGILPEKVRLRKDKSAAPMIYYWEENNQLGDTLLHWARKCSTLHPKQLENLDAEKLIRGYDPSLSENLFNGRFFPQRPVGPELLMRYFTR